MAVFIVNGPEENTIAGQAKPLAMEEIEEEDQIFARFAADKKLQEAVAQKFLSEGRHPDRCACTGCCCCCHLTPSLSA